MAKRKLKKVHVRGHKTNRKIEVPERKLKRRKGSDRITTMPSKLTLRARKIVYAAIEAGLPITRCHSLIGVDQSTMYKYLKYGEDPRYRKYYNFRQKIKKIKARREIEALKVIRECAAGGFKKKKTKVQTGDKGTIITTTETTLSPQWQAAAWFLERKDKSNWGRDPVSDAKSAAELAREIQEAQLLLQNSIPNEED